MVLVCPSQPLQIWCFLWHIEWHVTGVETRIRRQSLWYFFSQTFWWFWYVLDYAVCRVKECWRCCINVCALSWTCMTCHWKAWGFVGCIMASYVSLHSFLVRKSFLATLVLCLKFRPLISFQGVCLVWSTFLLDCIESWGVPEFFVGRFITGRASTVSFGNLEILLANR